MADDLQENDAGEKTASVDKPRRWLVSAIVGALGIVALLRALRGGPPHQTTPASTGAGGLLPAPEEIRHNDGRIEHPRVRYEATDISSRRILVILVASALVAVVLHAAVWFLFQGYEQSSRLTKASSYPLSVASPETLPAEPRLEQVDRLEGEQKENASIRESKRISMLNSYGRTAERSYVHIPIDQAMRLVQQELRSRLGNREENHRDRGLVDSGEPNSGRLYREEPR